ncbi:hypothetical protein IGI04_024282 [Brassica rapa subsp. trilocularis]|uniref:Uncharacterized protein n=1 Tax=Brassica rapa subsp. trilocularis TaxID=1813537 RepID=A0ABQ7M9P7_BRACM|nr:hypothetical protein IGI04_024282 [Brassica rapa subsp. trilocularis]
MRLALAKLWKFKYKKIDVDQPVSIVDEDDLASHLLPIQWPQPQNEEIFLAMEEAAFEEKKLRVIEKEDGDGNSNTGSCTDHIPEINIILLPAKTETHMKNMIQVSSTKKSLFFYVNLAPSLHTAITMVVTIFEILKNIGLTTKKKMKNEAKGTIFFLSLSFSIILLRVATESHEYLPRSRLMLDSSCSISYVCYGSTTSTPLFAREIMTVKHVLGVIAAAYAITSSFFIKFKSWINNQHNCSLFPSGREALILFFQSKQFIDSLGMTILRCTFMLFCSLIDKSLKPYQRVKIETLRCRFVFLNTTKVLNILLQHGYKIWKEMYGEDLDDSNVALYSEWK